MKVPLHKHIEYLLPKYRCVIIPEFGAFILNEEYACTDIQSNTNYPPKCSIVYNPDLKHDDGILVFSISKTETISYEAAQLKIRSIVSDIKQTLRNSKSFTIDNIGIFHQEKNDTIRFESNRTFVSPEFYGLSGIELISLRETINTISEEEKESKIKYLWGGAAAAAAALLFFFLPSTKITENSKPSQQADFIQSLSRLTSTSSTIQDSLLNTDSIGSSITDNIMPFNNIEDILSSETSVERKQEVEQKSKIRYSRKYYIIVGSEISLNQAKKQAKRIQESGYTNVEIIECPDRYRIYIASFNNREEADKFLTIHQKKDPYAWLFSQSSYN